MPTPCTCCPIRQKRDGFDLLNPKTGQRTKADLDTLDKEKLDRLFTHGSLIFIEVFKIYKLLNLLKLEKLFFVGSPIVFGLNFGQNRPFFALQKSNFGFAWLFAIIKASVCVR